MKKFALVLAVAVMIFPGSAGAGGRGDSARGRGSDFNGTEFSFSASSNFNGSDPSGTVKLYQAFNATIYTITARVTCLQVTGNTASIAAQVTDISPNNNLLASSTNSLQVQAIDGGKGGTVPDAATVFRSSTPPQPAGAVCVSPFTPQPLSRGEVVIQDALS